MTADYYTYTQSRVGDAVNISKEVIEELKNACAKWPAFNSAHEGYAILLEEVDELWEHIKTNQNKRDIGAMRGEAIQIAAMAMRFALDICNERRGRK